MSNAPAVVVTSIAAPNGVLRQIAADCIARELHFYLIGDHKSPADFELDGCDFYSLQRQRELRFETARHSLAGSYARKNIGYLLAMQQGCTSIIETDDDNLPRADFYQPLPLLQTVPVVRATGWVNVYRYFSDTSVWPRGLPLDAVHDEVPALPHAAVAVACPIQQGLADDNPDVDAVYRLLMPLPVVFRKGVRVALGSGAWCPFNSQNTVFWPDAFPLLYLPSHCSFRMTDIWRSFVAQRIAWENGWHVLFREATVTQLRNDHSLMKDFAEEVPGYLHNRKIAETLAALALEPGVDAIPRNLRAAYGSLIQLGVIGDREMPLLEAWLADLQSLGLR